MKRRRLIATEAIEVALRGAQLAASEGAMLANEVQLSGDTIEVQISRGDLMEMTERVMESPKMSTKEKLILLREKSEKLWLMSGSLECIF